jgi:uncharacterized protein with HEPN domain
VKTDRLPDYLDHIIEGVIYIEEFVSGMTLADFEHDIKTQDAVLRRLEIIGEAAGSILRISPDFTADHPDMRLVDAKRMRDRLAHHYENVEIPIVWSTVQNDLPSLRVSAVAALAGLQAGTGTRR